jgi:NADH-quinone oxidoreductase subunit A
MLLSIYTHDYLHWSLFLVVTFLLIFLLFLISSFFSAGEIDVNIDKLSIYECGFDPFGSIRKKFDIKYYIVAILFIVFDLEIVLLLPWLFIYLEADFTSFIILFFFLFILVLGFMYE